MPFLAAFAKLRKAATSFVVAIRPHETCRLPLDEFSQKWISAYFSQICRETQLNHAEKARQKPTKPQEHATLQANNHKFHGTSNHLLSPRHRKRRRKIRSLHHRHIINTTYTVHILKNQKLDRFLDGCLIYYLLSYHLPCQFLNSNNSYVTLIQSVLVYCQM